MKKNFIQRLFSPTPKQWLWVAGTFGGMALCVTGAYAAVTALSIAMPDWFNHSVGYIIFGCTFVAGYAKQKEKK